MKDREPFSFILVVASMDLDTGIRTLRGGGPDSPGGIVPVRSSKGNLPSQFRDVGSSVESSFRKTLRN